MRLPARAACGPCLAGTADVFDTINDFLASDVVQFADSKPTARTA
ncbi:MAG: hypothetical protein ACYDHH_32305 [Solirubrobacteraceae bacterium]